MDFTSSFYNQSSGLSINIMIVDDDPVFLKIISRLIEKSKYSDPSVMEIRVIAEKDPREALSTLQDQRNNIDLIITDYYMPDMNGLQLKNEITQKFGNLPVLVMSVDKEKEQESLTCGALGFFPKPIKTTDLPRIYQFALTYKRNGKSIMSSTELNQDTHVSIPKQINLLPDPQANVIKTKKRHSDSMKKQKRNPKVGPSDDGESQSLPAKKAKVIWTRPLHNKFLEAIEHIGHSKVVPKKILEFMNEPNLTRENIASHLQKYRIFMRKVANKSMASISPDQGLDSIFRSGQIDQPSSNQLTPPTSWLDTSLSDRSFDTRSGYGLGQSRLLSKTPESSRFNQMPNYMNRSSIYQPNRIGSRSNFTLPIQNNPFLVDQPSPNVETRSFFDQTSLGFGFGLFGPNYNNFNNGMMSGYGNFASNQPGSSHLSYGSIESFLNNENGIPFYNDLDQTVELHASTQPYCELPQMENLYGDLDENNELLNNITSNSEFYQQQQGEDASTNFDLSADFLNELDQIPPLEDLVNRVFANTDQDQFNGETSNIFAVRETNPPIFNENPIENHFDGETSNILSAMEANPSVSNMNPIQNQEQDDVSDFINWSSWELEELFDDGDFMNLFSDMNNTN